MCVLATQVQARTQQLTALEGQSELLLYRAHGPESSSSPLRKARQARAHRGRSA